MWQIKPEIMRRNEWKTIPILPCLSLDETIGFWQLLGYTTTYYQNRPYQYGVIEREGAQLHLSRRKGFEPSSNPTYCIVIVQDVYNVYLEFIQSLRQHLGRVPNSGLPRISRMKPEQTRFTVTDPAGNAVIFINEGEKDQEDFEKPNNPELTALQKSIALAIRLRDFKIDIPAAVKVIDTGLKHITGEKNVDIGEALLIRGMLANEMNDVAGENTSNLQFRSLDLTKEEMELIGRKSGYKEYIDRLLAKKNNDK